MPNWRHHLRAAAGNWSDAGGRPADDRAAADRQDRAELPCHPPPTFAGAGAHCGTFEVAIPVREAKELLPSEARLLAVFKSIAASIRPNSIWFPVFQRYLATIDGRVRGLGGNPDLIGPSPTGNVPDGALPIPPGTPGVDSFGLIDKCCKEVARACGRPCGSLSRPSCCLSSCFSY
jgi:hypothetical protein